MDTHDFREMLTTGVEMFWRTAHAFPEDKLDWKPSETARSAREIIQELPLTTAYSTKLLEEMKDPGMDDGYGSKTTDIKKLEEEHREAVEKFIYMVEIFPEHMLSDKVVLPWQEMTFREAVEYVYWNTMYHYGQIAYIQTLYGDKEMY